MSERFGGSGREEAPVRPERRSARIEDLPPRRALALFLLANAALRLALLPLNQAEYTDGVLQITQSAEPTALWPPLYGWLAAALARLPRIEPLYAGRLISALAGVLGLIPLWRLARRAGGPRAALFCAFLYTLAPVSLRWSGRMMSDSLFAALFWAALERWSAAWPPALGRLRAEAAALRARQLDLRLAAAAAFTAAATLTRYQGILLLPLIAFSWVWLAVAAARARRRAPGADAPGLPWRALAAFALLFAAPVWARLQGVAHGQQFSDRLGGTLGSALQVISLNGEAFLALTPYFLTYPVAFWALLGLTRRGGGARARAALLAALYLGAAVLTLQAAFSSFQERYLLPWLGILWVWGGVGLAWARAALARRPRVFSAALGVTLAWSAMFALAVLVLQREAFGDYAAAGRWLRRHAPEGAAIYSTELYNAGLGGRRIATNKIRFFSGRAVEYFDPAGQTGAPSPAALRPGDLVCLHSVYPSPAAERWMREGWNVEPVFEAQSVIVPLLPDIMAQPGTAQNPTAWMWRYTPQAFSTTIWRVKGPR